MAQPSNNTTNPLLTVKDVANYLGVTQRTVYRLMKAYRLPACKIGGQWRFRAESIEVWMHEETGNAN
ncbi:MAG: DNA-binding protein [Nitrospirae bacterium]|nr:MAG: DNA-binding protein [Nitrospirota bacterium]